MAKRIIWSKEAKQDRREILEFWFQRTGNKKYSRKLAKQFAETIRFISQHNYLGRAVDEENVRVSVCGHNLIFYRVTNNLLEIVSLFDSRQDPDKLMFD
ncbi:type II toxin-antitoxin system RelE/ParE family toxin [Adhaeribacter soli]|uniref:Type II toxin-antitoxin system RelE/ParE family toxin n=1 Tax=Adhaeribacter soli TaxID=2607655 RepID=A0A5N1IN47_9BACT|nr:type II toxin-antitoxin system RelE/ParE family toxin [Adhaeribacter soli]KAA9325211.1 type II toxin-antitoxin system RelE/ParE family toxin [Adhaeribacter soli]